MCITSKKAVPLGSELTPTRGGPEPSGNELLLAVCAAEGVETGLSCPEKPQLPMAEDRGVYNKGGQLRLVHWLLCPSQSSSPSGHGDLCG